MGLKLTTDRHPPITSQTHYPLSHAALSNTSNLSPTQVKPKQFIISFLSYSISASSFQPFLLEIILSFVFKLYIFGIE